MSGDDALAVKASKVVRNYSVGFRKQLQVLKGIDMTVPKGKIYGLLGPSGSGKTTWIKCIMGRLSIHGGELQVLGGVPGSRGHTVPGPSIGYMPQELALYGEFTTMETLEYFAKLHGMSQSELQTRASFLLKFLDMAHLKTRLISQMSGGQQRRVSLAAALLHRPSLLLLDEPTVGVSSILRARIWEHLVELVQSTGTTVIITTHYIEEARQADIVGMMGDGKLLVEDTPQSLLERYRKQSLEDVFLAVCQEAEQEDAGAEKDAFGESNDVYGSGSGDKDNAGADTDDEESPRPSRHGHPSVYSEVSPLLSSKRSTSTNSIGGDTTRFGTTTTSTSRRQPAPAAALVSPLSTSNRQHAGRPYSSGTALTPTAAVKKDTSMLVLLWLAVVRFFKSFVEGSRVPKSTNIRALLWKNFTRYRRNYGLLLFQFLLPSIQIVLFCTAVGRDPADLSMAVVNGDTGNFGALYLTFIDPSTINQVAVASHDEGVAGVRRGDYWGVIDIGANFTTDLVARFAGQGPVPSDVIIGSTVNVTLDMTNQQVAIIIEQKVSDAFESMAKQVLQELHQDPDIANLPVQIQTPVYGDIDPKFTDFIAPAMIINIAFAMSIGLTALSFVLEKKEGLLDRTWAAGVSPGEVLIGHTVTQFCVLLVQLGLLLLFALVVFGAPMEGSLALVLLLSVLLGLAGMTFGLLISSVSKDETTAVQMALGSFYPVMLLSGVLWPVEAIPHGLNYVSYALPTTWASEAMRSLMSRGWGMDHTAVWAGFVSTVAWSVVLLLLALRGISSRD